MSNKEGADFYRNLSRKELQSLCKKYGLPARKSSSEMAESLFSYTQEFFGVSFHYSQGVSQSQFVSQRGESGVIHNQPCSGRIEHTSICQHKCVSSTRSYAKAPASFEFYASSEEGIKLCVDLSSSPVDWIKNYKNQVSFCKNVDNAKSKSLHQELRCIGENDKQKNSSPNAGDFAEHVTDGFVEVEPSSSLDMEEYKVGNDHRVGTNAPLILLPSRTCSEVPMEDSDCLREDLGPISPKTNSDVHFQMFSNTELCNKNGSSTTLVSDVTDIPTEITACNSILNSISDGSVDVIAIENQNSTYEKVHENSILWNNCNLENNCDCVVPRFLTSSTEMEQYETVNYHKGESFSANKDGELLNQDESKCNVVTEQAALTTSSGNDHSESHMAVFTEVQEGSNISFWGESSVCSQVENSVGTTGLRYGNLELKDKFQKKRSIDNGFQNGYSKSDTKILRIMKYSDGEDFPRRSMRLVSR